MNLNEIKLKALTETLTTGKISDSEYFSEKYANYVSNSRLGLINPNKDGTPEKFFGPMEPIYSDSLILGSAVHQQVLQPGYFELIEINRPNAKLGFVCDYIWEHGKELTDEVIIEASNAVGYYKDSLNDKKIDLIKETYEPYYKDKIAYTPKEGIEPMFLSSKMYETANNCIQACNNNEYFTKLMHPECILEEPICENEQAFLLDIECNCPNRDPFIIKWKSKLDNFTINFEDNSITVNDLKTIGAILPKFDGPDGNFVRYSYYRELAAYLWLLKQYVEKQYGMKNPHMYVNCLVVSTIPGYYTKTYAVTNKEIERGFNEFKYLLKLVAFNIAYKGYGLN